jgi:hypothetical protein
MAVLSHMQVRVAQFLREAHTGVLSALAGASLTAMPMRYRAVGLEVDCLLPRWSELACLADESLPAVLVVVSVGGPWLEMRGAVQPVDDPVWSGLAPERPRGPGPEELYRVLRMVPVRIDLFDGSAGWGSRETLDL